MMKTVNLKKDFCEQWSGTNNFQMAGECAPLNHEFPALEKIVEFFRKEPTSRIGSFANGLTSEGAFEREFRNCPIEQAMNMPFYLANFSLNKFQGKGQIFEFLEDGIMQPWRRFLATMGFSWYRCYPIVFISGKGAPGVYHLDLSHVLAWQVYGTKVFNSLRNPLERLKYTEAINPDFRNNLGPREPADLSKEDILSIEMPPGTLLWNQVLTPHWVSSLREDVAFSLNISHGGLRCDGKLSPAGEVIEKYFSQNEKERF